MTHPHNIRPAVCVANYQTNGNPPAVKCKETTWHILQHHCSQSSALDWLSLFIIIPILIKEHPEVLAYRLTQECFVFRVSWCWASWIEGWIYKTEKQDIIAASSRQEDCSQVLETRTFYWRHLNIWIWIQQTSAWSCLELQYSQTWKMR